MRDEYRILVPPSPRPVAPAPAFMSITAALVTKLSSPVTALVSSPRMLAESNKPLQVCGSRIASTATLISSQPCSWPWLVLLNGEVSSFASYPVTLAISLPKFS